VQETDLST